MTKIKLFRIILLFLVGLLPLGVAAQQTKFVAWEFDTSNNQVPDNQIINATTGSGTVSFFSTGNYTVVPEDRAYGCVKFTAGSNSSLTDADWTNPEKHNNYIQAEFSTTGYQKPVVSFAMAADTGAKWRLVYSANGGESWVDAGEYETDQHWGTAKTFDNIAVNATNKEKVIFRILNITNGTRNSYDSRFKSFVVMAEEYSLPSYNNEQGTITWPFDLGTEGQTGTYSPANITDAFKTNYVQLGSSLSYAGTGKANDSPTVQTLIQAPSVTETGPSANNAIDFFVVTKTGLKFTPSKVSFTSTRHGTGGGNIDISWVNSDGTEISLATAQKPERNNQGAANHTDYSYTITDAHASEGICGLRIYFYNTDRKYGFANIVIEGTIDGQLADVRQCKVSVAVSPEGAGTAKISPVGNEFDEGTELTFTQTPNFGYRFKNWTDAAGTELSTKETLEEYVLNDDAVITANYDKINTYALSYNVAGGANDYMVTLSPEPNVIDGKNMYEDGTKVTLTASSNPILTFTNWSTGETSSEIAVTMTEDTEVTANYDAVDFVAAWDFEQSGGDGRKADFYSADNDVAQLVMRTAEGATSGWLDKSNQAAGGYEGRPGAVNWRTTGLGEYYWQTQLNCEAFTDIKVKTAMTFNYNAYSTYNVEYSLNGEDWKKAGAITIPGSKNWIDADFALPAECNNQPAVYLRWIADKTSDVKGSPSNNDGICLGATWVLGTAQIVDDGTAPKLVSTVPAEGNTTASANGKIVLTFDEKVKVADGAVATLGTQVLTPSVSGKTVIFEYKGLDYSTAYTFTLPANKVADLTDNYLADEIVINFTTKTRPAVEKAMYDFIVPDDGTFNEAITAANSRASKDKRFYIFVKDGSYEAKNTNGGTVVGSDNKTYPSVTTDLTASNVSIIGESMNGTVVYNKPVNAIEGLGKATNLCIQNKVENTYIQDLTLTHTLGDNGRVAVLQDRGNKTICKTVNLDGFQDTYYSNQNGSRFYFETSSLGGRVDFCCGGGDVVYNQCDLVVKGDGTKITAAGTPAKYGYVFLDCTIKGDSKFDGKYTLGRPWSQGACKVYFINTTMDILPTAAGWDEMSGGWPAAFKEYNSHTASGTPVSLANRKIEFGETRKDGQIVTEAKPVPGTRIPLTEAELAELTLENVMGGTDDWDPASATEQASAPANVKIEGSALTWDNSNYVLCWAVCKDGKVVAFTTEPVYTADDATATWSVRAANEMGGLGEASVATVSTGIDEIADGGNGNVVSTSFYNLQGICVGSDYKGVVIKVDTLLDGKKISTKLIR